ncbi:MAG: LysR family transcriptional regulator [Thiotrichaceae bacterium]|nr:LysR family transcriptional regulator [Thiotrichaceae bacterium]PCI12244.1 MAG: LysR family transcriptional regulator [Thiotrichales bacterium]
MNISDIKAFVSVAQHHSFSQAAEQLHMTQPAISKRIAVLESSLDARLFDRIGRSVTLTTAGHALLPHAKKILLEVSDSQRAIHNLSGAVSGQLSIGTSHHIGLHRLPNVLKSFNQTYTEVQLDLHFLDSEMACREVEQANLELAVVTLPPLDSDRNKSALLLIPIWNDPLVLVTAHDHPLCSLPNISDSDLLKHTAILPSHGTFTRTLIDQHFNKQTQPLEINLETNYLETIKMLVSIGQGWSILPETLVDETLRLHHGCFSAQRTLGIVHHRKRTLSNAALAFINICKTQIE